MSRVQWGVIGKVRRFQIERFPEILELDTLGLIQRHRDRIRNLELEMEGQKIILKLGSLTSLEIL
jgi:hypothetical protein